MGFFLTPHFFQRAHPGGVQLCPGHLKSFPHSSSKSIVDKCNKSCRLTEIVCLGSDKDSSSIVKLIQGCKSSRFVYQFQDPNECDLVASNGGKAYCKQINSPFFLKSSLALCPWSWHNISQQTSKLF